MRDIFLQSKLSTVFWFCHMTTRTFQTHYVVKVATQSLLFFSVINKHPRHLTGTYCSKKSKSCTTVKKYFHKLERIISKCTYKDFDIGKPDPFHFAVATVFYQDTTSPAQIICINSMQKSVVWHWTPKQSWEYKVTSASDFSIEVSIKGHAKM